MSTKPSSVSESQSRCSRCGQLKPLSMLSGYDPLAEPDAQFRNAYCIRLSKCNSAQARGMLKELAGKLK